MTKRALPRVAEVGYSLPDESKPRKNQMELVKLPPPEPKYKKLNLRQQVAVIDLLREKCREENGFAIYAPGYSDEQIQAEAIPDYKGTVNGVQTIRRQLFGDLRKRSAPQNNVDRLERVERAVAFLFEKLGEDLNQI